ncbi:MAG: bifunctional serine/threonine-protein kinase/formylglycine-generating enzyme family protein [Candidatus Aminicenantes bacterium]|nr:bifunctional serine/threonine-protein kinase/formylglycine-generating enzyme family protein [Candidatus Aminicenantes bacterium]
MTNMKKIGKYTISGEIARGGMGVLYRAQDPFIGRTVAIKTIRLDILQGTAGKEEALKRFLREAQSVGNLSHPNIVTIYDVGEDEGLIYIAMEYVDGRSLEDLLKQNKKFSLDEIVQLFSQIAAALDYAHKKGIVHRDIKPANILVDANHKVTIVDFGIARTTASTMTQTGMLMGTPRYMSPEQISGKKVDNRADIFSLGAILYELLTQCNPFEGESITTVIYKIMHAELRPISEFNKQLPAELDGVVRKALARDADARYQTCRELLDDLKKCSLSSGRADTVNENHGKKQETQLLDGPGMVAPAAVKAKNPLFAVLVVMIVVLGIIFGVIWLNGRKSSAPPGGGYTPAPPLPAGAVDTGAAKGVDSTAAKGGGPETGPQAGPLPAAGMKKQLPAAPPSATPTPAALPAPAEKTESKPGPPAVGAVRNAKGFVEQVFFNRTVMVLIPAGDFVIGSPSGQGNEDEHPAHKVFIPDFWLGKTTVNGFRKRRCAISACPAKPNGKRRPAPSIPGAATRRRAKTST